MEQQIMNPSEELRNAVFSSQTNYVFKKMLAKVSRVHRRKFVRLLKVDVHNVKPIYFNGQAYKSKDHKDNIFLFIDKEFELIGILFGSTWDKDWESYESYDMKRSWHSDISKSVIKNRSNMQQIAAHILMITPEMKVPFNRKTTTTAQPRFVDKTRARRSLANRLKEYKLKKHSISNEEVKQVCKDLITYLTPYMFDKDKEEEIVSKKPVSRWFTINSVAELIKDVADLSANIDYQEKTLKRNHFINDYAQRELDSLKVEIINYRNAYLQDEN